MSKPSRGGPWRAGLAGLLKVAAVGPEDGAAQQGPSFYSTLDRLRQSQRAYVTLSTSPRFLRTDIFQSGFRLPVD